MIGAVHTLAVELQAAGVNIRWQKLLGRACARSSLRRCWGRQSPAVYALSPVGRLWGGYAVGIVCSIVEVGNMAEVQPAS